MYSSKILALYQAGEGGAFWPAAYFDPKELFFHWAIDFRY